MFCTNCGKELDENARFCTNCGTQIRPREAAPETPVSPAVPAAPAKENTPPATQGIYNGKTRMGTFRNFSGIMFLVSSVLAFLVFIVRQLGIYSMTGNLNTNAAGLMATALVTFLFYEIFASWIPGISSLVLQKPTKTRSVILAIIIGVCMVISWVVNGISVTPGNVSVSYDFSDIAGILFADGLFFCTLMAVISIFQPASLVGEPAPTKAKAWKIVEGVLNIISGIFILLAGFAGLVMMIMLIAGYGGSAFFSIASMFLGLFLPGVWMLVGGILSVRCGSGNHRPLSSAYADFMVLVLLLSAFTGPVEALLTGKMPIEYYFRGSSDTSTIISIAVLVVVLLLIIWYLVCTVISMITAFNKKSALS